MKKIIKILLRIYTLCLHPSTLIYYKAFKGTIFYPGCILKNAKYMVIQNTTFARKCCIKAFKGKDKKVINIRNSYFADYAYISSKGNLCIKDACFSPYVFIGTYKHSITKKEQDASYYINIDSPKFIGQNVSIFGNVNINKGVVIGACTVVTKDCLSDSMYLGNPAKRIKHYDDVHDIWIKI